MQKTPAATPGADALQPFIDKGLLAGAVTLVASKEEVLSVEAVGWADLGTKKPMEPDSLFWIASMTKPVTATALMMLVDEGKVNVLDPVEKYLPEFKGQMVVVERDEEHVLLRRPTHPITVEEILTHTSGLPFRTAVETPTLDRLPLKIGTLSYSVAPLEFEPGTRFLYSNAGTNTAGRILEVVSGMEYAAFLDERLLHPLGMMDTTFVPNEEQAARLAKTYKPREDGSLEETPHPQMLHPLTHGSRLPFPAGGLFSTARDMGQFCRMVANGGTLDGKRYLSEAAVREMTRLHTGHISDAAEGLGWRLPEGRYGHGGALNTNMWIGRNSGLVTVYLIQSAGFPPGGEKAADAFQKAAEEAFLNGAPL